ncbi:Proprotein convertase P-domain-containing protein [Sulfidibacter corallicola]|uniref:Proprotein convertase P-domain-containing protein n=1 Tax=Sulfidibacter corallicola TaxID=2818388 RepID=A0A8A4TSN3_SULCO|nr:putative Ig domain-containing protein [Sulfidibacter corallicola]QTD52513.1 proprotein convertase P-domain-containing protein [Sulfidibacter corallicola]
MFYFRFPSPLSHSQVCVLFSVVAVLWVVPLQAETLVVSRSDLSIAIPDGASDGVRYTLEFGGASQDAVVTSLDYALKVASVDVEDMEIILESPTGKRLIVWRYGTGGTTDQGEDDDSADDNDIYLQGRYDLVVMDGEPVNGAWKWWLRDLRNGNPGRLESCELRLDTSLVRARTSHNTDVDDGRTAVVSLTTGDVPDNAMVTQVRYKLKITDVVVSDMEMRLRSPDAYIASLWPRGTGGATDSGHDDDASDDDDIWLNWRETDDFQGRHPEGTWRLYVYDRVSNGQSGYVDFVDLKVDYAVPPGAPSSRPSVSVLGPHTIRVSWSPVSGASRYRLERQEGTSGAWHTISCETSRTYTDRNLEPDTLYRYRVRAGLSQAYCHGEPGWSAPGRLQPARTEPLPVPSRPSPPNPQPIDMTTVRVDWNRVTDAVRYRLQGRAVGETWRDLYCGSARSYTHTGLQQNTTYAYRLAAGNETSDCDGTTGWSSYSAEVDIHTDDPPPRYLSGSVEPQTGSPGDEFHFVSRWHDPDDYVVDVKVRYRRQGGGWREAVLFWEDEAFSRNVVVDGAPGRYDFEFQASDADTPEGGRKHTTAWTGGGSFSLTGDSPAYVNVSEHAQAAAHFLVQAGVLQLPEDLDLAGTRPATRAEFAAMIFRALGGGLGHAARSFRQWSDRAQPTVPFGDIRDPDTWFFDAVAFLAHLTYMDDDLAISVFNREDDGRPVSLFMPERHLARRSAVKALMEAWNRRVMDPAAVEPHMLFDDLPAEAPLAGYVYRAKALGVVSGEQDGGSFSPDRPILREECFLMLHRIMAADANLNGDIDAFHPHVITAADFAWSQDSSTLGQWFDQPFVAGIEPPTVSLSVIRPLSIEGEGSPYAGLFTAVLEAEMTDFVEGSVIDSLGNVRLAYPFFHWQAQGGRFVDETPPGAAIPFSRVRWIAPDRWSPHTGPVAFEIRLSAGDGLGSTIMKRQVLTLDRSAQGGIPPSVSFLDTTLLATSGEPFTIHGLASDSRTSGEEPSRVGIREVRLFIADDAGNWELVVADVPVDTDHRWTATWLAPFTPGSYRLRAVARNIAGYVESAEATLIVAPAFVVSGYVSGPDGRPLVNARVVMNGPDAVVLGWTDEQGRFSLAEGLTAATYSLHAEWQDLVGPSLTLTLDVHNRQVWRTLVLDGRPPFLTARFLEAVARRPFIVTVTADEPLADVPRITLQTAAGTVLHGDGVPNDDSDRLVWQAEFVLPSEPGLANMELTGTDLSGNEARVDLNVTIIDLDMDRDGLPNDFETLHGFDPQDPTDAHGDPDGDGLDNLGEFAAGTDPRHHDSDEDGMPDGFELDHQLDPDDSRDAQHDLDGDTHSNVAEYEAGTDPSDPSSVPNRTPVLVAEVGDRQARVGRVFSLDLAPFFEDPDGDALVFSVTEMPAGFDLSSAGLLQGTPAIEGLFPVAFEVADDRATPRSVSHRFDLHVARGNRPPTLRQPIPDVSSRVNESLSLDLQAYFEDPDGDALHVSAEPLPEGLVLLADGLLQGASNQAGTMIVTVVATDDGEPALQTETTFRISIDANGFDPVFAFVQSGGQAESVDWFTTLRWTDDNTPNVHVSAFYANDPTSESGTAIFRGMPLEREINHFDWDTREVPPGTYHLFAVVADDHGNQVIRRAAYPLEIAHRHAPVRLDYIRTGESLDPLRVHAISTNSQGHTLVSGYFHTRVRLGDRLLHASGEGTSAFLARYDQRGRLLWAREYGSSRAVHFYDIVLDEDGRIFATGFLLGTVPWLDSNPPGSGGHRVLVASLTEEGEPVWVHVTEGGPTAYGTELALDAQGRAHVVGRYTQDLSIGGHDLPGAGSTFSVFVAKFDHEGRVLWASAPEGTGSANNIHLALDSDDRIHVAANYQGSLAWDDHEFDQPEPWRIFRAELNDQGRVVDWLGYGGGAYAELLDFAMAPDGVFWFAGRFSDDVTFGDDVLQSVGDRDGFVVRGREGSLAWARRAGGLRFDEFSCLVPDGQGGVFLGGTTARDSVAAVADFGTWQLRARGPQAGVLARVDEEGHFTWVDGASGFGTSSITAMSLGTAGFPLIAGSHADRIAIGPAEIQAQGSVDSFLAQMAPLSVEPVADSARFAFVEPDGFEDVAFNEFLIRWQDRDQLGTGGRISLYFDVDADGADGHLILANLNERDAGLANSHLWSTEGVEPGIYYLYAHIRDDHGGDRIVYSDDPVVVGRPRGGVLARVIEATPISPAGSDLFVAKQEVDREGRHYQVGTLRGSAVFGNRTVRPLGEAQGFVAKYGADMSLEWFQTFPVTESSGFEDFHLREDQGKLQVVGTFSGTLRLPSGEEISSAETAVLKLLLDVDGNLEEARILGHGLGSGIWRFAADGSCYLATHYRAGAVIGDVTLPHVGHTEALLARFDSESALDWVQSMVGGEHEQSEALVLTEAGDLIWGGQFHSGAQLGDRQLHSRGHVDIFMAYLTADGALQSLRTLGSEFPDALDTMALDDAGSVWLAGRFQDRLVVADHQIAGESEGINGFLLRFHQDGDFHWARVFHGQDHYGRVFAEVMTKTRRGMVLGGGFYGPVHMGGMGLMSLWDHDRFLVEFDIGGEPLWVRRLGGWGRDSLRRVTYDSQTDRLAAFGTFAHHTRLGPHTLLGDKRSQAFRLVLDLVDRGCLPGDVSGNGEILSYDAAQVLKHDAGIPSVFEPLPACLADVTCDGSISALDASMIMRVASGLDDEFACVTLEKDGFTEGTATAPDLDPELGERFDYSMGLELPGTGIRSFAFTLSYDHQLLQMDGSNLEHDLPDDWMVFSERAALGHLRVAAAGREPLKRDFVHLSIPTLALNEGEACTWIDRLVFDEIPLVPGPLSCLRIGSGSCDGEDPFQGILSRWTRSFNVLGLVRRCRCE